MKVTSEGEKRVFAALTKARIAFVDADAGNGGSRVDFVLSEPAGLHIDVIEHEGAVRYDVIRVQGEKAISFLAALLEQRHEIDRLRQALEEAEVLRLSADQRMQVIASVSG